MRSDVGIYDEEYAACGCFWGREPGKVVRMLEPSLTAARILDVGAGEGKNALFLAERGHRVVAVESSEAAIANFGAELTRVPEEVAARIEIVRADARDYTPEGIFDAVIAYGLLHCLQSVDEVRGVTTKMQYATASKGYAVVVALTDELTPPIVQPYLHPSPLSSVFLTELFAEWEILFTENGYIDETHPTTSVPHRHSVVRLLARKS